MELTFREHVAPEGHVRLTVYRPDGTVRDEREASNIMCVAGTSQLAAAANWSMAQDQNAAMGSPLTPQNLYPIYGALGSSDTPETSGDTQLGAELARAIVSEASTSSTVILLFFFFGTSISSWTIQEAGVFVSGAETASATASSGLLLDHTTFTAITKTAAETALLAVTFDW